MAKIELRNISFTYNKEVSGGTKALDHVSLTIEA